MVPFASGSDAARQIPRHGELIPGNGSVPVDPHRVMAAGEQAAHRHVVRHHPRHQLSNVTQPSRGDRRAQQERSDAVMLEPVIHGDRQLLDAVSQRLEDEVAGYLPTGLSHESVTAEVIRPGKAEGLPVIDSATRAMEASDPAVWRQVGVEEIGRAHV